MKILDYYPDIKLQDLSVFYDGSYLKFDVLLSRKIVIEKYRFGFLDRLYQYEAFGSREDNPFRESIKWQMKGALNGYYTHVSHSRYFVYLDYLNNAYGWNYDA